MKNLLRPILNKALQRRNSARVSAIIAQMSEKRPLPMTSMEFDVWADRVISGAMVPATITSQKWTLANLLLSLSPQEDHKEDGYFIKTLRKYMVNEVADAVRRKLKEEHQARQLAADPTPAPPQVNNEATQTGGPQVAPKAVG